MVARYASRTRHRSTSSARESFNGATRHRVDRAVKLPSASPDATLLQRGHASPRGSSARVRAGLMHVLKASTGPRVTAWIEGGTCLRPKACFKLQRGHASPRGSSRLREVRRRATWRSFNGATRHRVDRGPALRTGFDGRTRFNGATRHRVDRAPAVRLGVHLRHASTGPRVTAWIEAHMRGVRVVLRVASTGPRVTAWIEHPEARQEAHAEARFNGATRHRVDRAASSAAR